MRPRVNAASLAARLTGQTLSTPARGQPNTVLEIRDHEVIIGTQASPAGEPVSLAKLQQGLDLLTNTGAVRIEPQTFDGYRRSSAIGALIAALHGTIVSKSPIVISLSEETPIHDLLTHACKLMVVEPSKSKVTSSDPRYLLFTREIPKALDAAIDRDSYAIKGSAGQINFLWAETPWVAILDRIVTSSPQRGHYLVYLVHPQGRGIYLSLNQGVTESFGGASYQAELEARASHLRTFIPEADQGSLLARIDLGGVGRRTIGYEAANVAALFYDADEIPHDTILVEDLRRLLSIYVKTTEGLDSTGSMTNPDLPVEAQSGIESKRYRWHLRAEGRNGSVAQRAKQLGDYTCQVCQREFLKELGKMGKSCVDAHHLTPFSELDSHPRKLDPRKDFAIVCANCHRLLHSRTPPLSPTRLRQILKARRPR